MEIPFVSGNFGNPRGNQIGSLDGNWNYEKFGSCTTLTKWPRCANFSSLIISLAPDKKKLSDLATKRSSHNRTFDFARDLFFDDDSKKIV